MTTIETTVDIGPDRQLAIQVPENIAPGRHRIVVQIDKTAEETKPLDLAAHLPRLDLGPWPANLTLRREDIYGDDGR